MFSGACQYDTVHVADCQHLYELLECNAIDAITVQGREDVQRRSLPFGGACLGPGLKNERVQRFRNVHSKPLY